MPNQDKDYRHFLYSSDSAAPIICERKNWKNCPEHSHLTDVRPNGDSLNVDGIDAGEFVDDPNDDITSVNEYHYLGSGGSLTSRRNLPKLDDDDYAPVRRGKVSKPKFKGDGIYKAAMTTAIAGTGAGAVAAVAQGFATSTAAGFGVLGGAAAFGVAIGAVLFFNRKK